MDYAVVPFKPESEPISTISHTETWSSSIDTFSTSLNCTSALITPQTDPAYTFDNGRGCVVPDIELPGSGNNTSKFLLQYFSYYNDPNVDTSLDNPNCTAEHSNNFLVVWASNVTNQTGVYNNITAAFCVPSYHTQTLMTTVNASNHAIVDSISNIQEAPTSLPDNLFNTTQFEYLIGVGISSTTERVDHADSLVLEQSPQLEKFGLVWPTSHMVGFAVGLGGLPVEDLASLPALQNFFEKAHQLLFSAAFSTLATNRPGENHTQWQGTRQDNLGAVVLVRPIAIVVEVALGIIALLTISL
jgi:hypothetical protein